jgi:hypothetical protein
MTITTPDPISNNTDRVLVRSTVTGFEQSIAAVAGFFTAGPLGALASWGTIRGVQGKWTPWFILGVPGVVAINVVNIAALAVIGGGFGESDTSTYTPPATTESAPVTSTYQPPTSSLPSYNVSLSGGTTLVQKCQQIAQAQSNFDFGKVLSLSYQVGADHDTPWNTEVDEDCASVGVNTY